MRAVWNGAVIAESNATKIIEGNHYFPPASIVQKYFIPSTHTSMCGWKGMSNYQSLSVDGKENKDACWYYKDPKNAAKEIQDYYAFWKGVKVE